METREIAYCRDEHEHSVGWCPCCGALTMYPVACDPCFQRNRDAGLPFGLVECRDWFYVRGVQLRAEGKMPALKASACTHGRTGDCYMCEASKPSAKPKSIDSIPISDLTELLAATDPDLVAYAARKAERDPKGVIPQEAIERCIRVAVSRNETGAMDRAKSRVEAIVARVRKAGA